MEHRNSTFLINTEDNNRKMPKFYMKIDKPDSYEGTLRIGPLVIFFRTENELIEFKNNFLSAYNNMRRERGLK